MKPLAQHQIEIERNQLSRAAKPLIRAIYADFYTRIIQQLDRQVPGPVVEIGSGSGELKERIPDAVCSDIFPNPWLDVACDAYRLPFQDQSVSNMILLDVFHHLSRPMAFLSEAARVLASGGRVILFEPYISLISSAAYGWFHHEPVAWRRPLDLAVDPPAEQGYYAAQGNATRIFFRQGVRLPPRLEILTARASADFAYLLSGGLSRRAWYPPAGYPLLRRFDRVLSAVPALFAGRCLIVLRRD